MNSSDSSTSADVAQAPRGNSGPIETALIELMGSLHRHEQAECASIGRKLDGVFEQQAAALSQARAASEQSMMELAHMTRELDAEREQYRQARSELTQAEAATGAAEARSSQLLEQLSVLQRRVMELQQDNTRVRENGEAGVRIIDELSTAKKSLEREREAYANTLEAAYTQLRAQDARITELLDANALLQKRIDSGAVEEHRRTHDEAVAADVKVAHGRLVREHDAAKERIRELEELLHLRRAGPATRTAHATGVEERYPGLDTILGRARVFQRSAS